MALWIPGSVSRLHFLRTFVEGPQKANPGSRKAEVHALLESVARGPMVGVRAKQKERRSDTKLHDRAGTFTVTDCSIPQDNLTSVSGPSIWGKKGEYSSIDCCWGHCSVDGPLAWISLFPCGIVLPTPEFPANEKSTSWLYSISIFGLESIMGDIISLHSIKSGPTYSWLPTVVIPRLTSGFG